MYRYTKSVQPDARCSPCFSGFQPDEEVVTHDGKQFLHKECFDDYAKYIGFRVAKCISGCDSNIDYASFLTKKEKLRLKIKKILIPAVITALSILFIGEITKRTEGNFALVIQSMGVYRIATLTGVNTAFFMVNRFTRNRPNEAVAAIITVLWMYATFSLSGDIWEGLNFSSNNLVWQKHFFSLLNMAVQDTFLGILESHSIEGMPVISLGLLVAGRLCSFSSNLHFSIGAIFTGVAVSGIYQALLYKRRQQGHDLTLQKSFFWLS